MTPEEKLASMGLVLPRTIVPSANYVPFRWAGNLLFLSGQGPKKADGTFHIGRIGRDLTAEQAYEHARLAGLNLLGAAKMAVGELSRISAVVKLLGMVNAEPDLIDQNGIDHAAHLDELLPIPAVGAAHPKVINGCSDLLVDALGEAGRHARSAVGMGSLPNGMSVEVEAILLVD
jgi:enamine deaminase RidA (YjgF/YER057c/UK114 family)